MNPFFSIIVPVYNVAPYIRECLDSVLAQTFNDWEAICVDDGSSDESGSILDLYASKDSRFKILHQANAGVSSARNLAIGQLKGAWTFFLDSDDVLSPSALAKISEITDIKQDIDIVRFGLVQFQDGEQVKWPHSDDNATTFVDTKLYLPTTVTGGWFCQRCYKSTLVKQVKFPELRNGEDVVFMAKCNCLANAIAVIPDVLYGYRQRAMSASRLQSSLRLVRQIIGYTSQSLLEFDLSGKSLNNEYLRGLCNVATEELSWHIIKMPYGDRNMAWQEAFHCWKSLLKLRILPVVQRVRIGVVVALPFRLLAICFFAFPRKLKLIGIHR